MALGFTDGSTDGVVFGSIARPDDFLIGLWFRWTGSWPGTVRVVAGQEGAGGWRFETTATSGTFTCNFFRGSSLQKTEISGLGANTWHFVAFRLLHGSGPESWSGDLTTVPSANSSNAQDGSGSASLTANFELGGDQGPRFAMECEVAWVGYIDCTTAAPALNDVIQLWRGTHHAANAVGARLGDTLVNTHLGVWWGTGTQRDLSGQGNDGTPSGVTETDHPGLSLHLAASEAYASAVSTDRMAQVSALEFEVPTAPRRAQISAIEFETPTPNRRAQLSAIEFEVPTAPRRAQISAIEFETPTPNRRAQISAIEFEAPLAPRRTQLSAIEFETPSAARRVQLSAIEFEVPTAPRRAQTSALEFEVPGAPARAQISAIEFEAPEVGGVIGSNWEKTVRAISVMSPRQKPRPVRNIR